MINRILEECCKAVGISLDYYIGIMDTRKAEGVRVRRMASYIATVYGGFTHQYIADCLFRNVSMITHYIADYNNLLTVYPKEQELLKTTINKLKA